MTKSKSTSRSTSKAKSGAKSTTAKTRAKSKGRKKKPVASSNQNIEIVITLVLFFGFLIYGAGQCNKAKVAKDYAEAPSSIAQEVKLTTESSPKIDDVSTNKLPAKSEINLPKLAQKLPAPDTIILSGPQTQHKSVVAVKDTLQQYNQLWVTIDQLKLRSEPNLKSSVLMQFALFDRVYYLNQKTEFLQEINLGETIANEPWYLIQHPNGKRGWAYGAGLNFHKEKRQGVR